MPNFFNRMVSSTWLRRFLGFGARVKVRKILIDNAIVSMYTGKQATLWTFKNICSDVIDNSTEYRQLKESKI